MTKGFSGCMDITGRSAYVWAYYKFFMKRQIDFKTLKNFSEGKYSYNDYLKVKGWFSGVRNDTETEQELFEQWLSFSDAPADESLQTIYEKIHYQILVEERKQKRTLWHYYRQVAAVLAPIFIVSTVLYWLLFSSPEANPAWVEINVPEGVRMEFMLPDSTSGWLNSGARLKYPPVFSERRQVKLEGEAFFKVKHQDKSDFTVRIRDMDVQVLGTEFNVAAYANEVSSEVVLKEGKVKIDGRTASFSQVLAPGERLAYNRSTKRLTKDKVDPNQHVAWTDGFLIFDNEEFEKAAKKIERWYNVEIEIEGDQLKNLRFKGTFNDEPLEEVLRFIAMTTPINYEIEKRNQESDGTLKKKRVIIRLN